MMNNCSSRIRHEAESSTRGAADPSVGRAADASINRAVDPLTSRESAVEPYLGAIREFKGSWI